MPIKKIISTLNPKRSVAIKSNKDQKIARFLTAKRSFFSFKNILILAILLLVALFWLLRKYLIVATVNGQPISRFELNDRLSQQFGEQILDNLINERLIMGAARQQGIFVSSVDIDKRLKEIEERLAGRMTLAEALKLQGLNVNMLKRQIELQLSLEKLLGKEAQVSQAEIDEYLKANQSLYQDATEPAKIREEVKGFITQQKLNQSYEQWINKVRKDSKIIKNI